MANKTFLLFAALFFTVASGVVGAAEQKQYYHAWVGDINLDGSPDLLLESYTLIIPLTSGVLPVGGHGDLIAFCGDVDGGYTECNSVDPSALISPVKMRVMLSDVNNDGLTDYFLRPVESGPDSFILVQSGAGLEVTAIIPSSQLNENIDLSDAQVFVRFKDIDGDGLRDLVATTSGVSYVAYSNVGGAGEPLLSPVPESAGKSAVEFLHEPQEALVAARPNYSMQVTPTGQISFRYPIYLPPSTAGNVPTISIAYQSGGGGGFLPNGWSLTGFPVISRCSKVNYETGRTAGYAFTIYDALCGQHGRLLPVKGYIEQETAWGQYIYQSGSKNWVDTGNVNAVSKWRPITETLPDGSHIDYQPYQAFANTSYKSATLSWAAAEIYSASGAGSAYTYFTDSVSPRPKKITYANFTVEFAYKKYRGVRKSLGAKSVLDVNYYELYAESDELLTTITVSDSLSPVLTYHVGYEFSAIDGAPIVKYIQSCEVSDGEELCKPAVLFDFNEGLSSVALQKTEDFIASGKFDSLGGDVESVIADWDLDGIADIITLDNSGKNGEIKVYRSSDNFSAQVLLASSSSQKHRGGLAALDMNADGRPELVYMEREGTESYQIGEAYTTTGYYYVASSGSPGSGCVQQYISGSPSSMWRCQSTVNVPAETAEFYRYAWKRLDTTSTNYPPLPTFCIYQGSYNEWKPFLEKLRPSVRAVPGGDKVMLLGDSGGESGCTDPDNKYWVSAWWEGNVNYAKTSDAGYTAPVSLYRRDLSATIHLSSINDSPFWKSADGFKVITESGATQYNSLPAERSVFLDVNADGLSDYIYAREDAATGELFWWASLNGGGVFLQPYKMSSAKNVDIGLDRRSESDFNVKPFDYDGNEFPDILLANENGANYFIYQAYPGEDGNVYFKEIDTRIPTSVSPDKIRIADFDGDGKPEIAELFKDSVDIINIDRPDRGLLLEVKEQWPGADAELASTTFTWSRSVVGDSASFTFDDFLNDENYSLTAFIPVVKKMSSPNGIGGIGHTKFHYDTFVMNRHGRGLLGVRSFERSNAQAKSSEIYKYDVSQENYLTWPFLALREKIQESEGGLKKTLYGVVRKATHVCWPESGDEPVFWFQYSGGQASESCNSGDNETVLDGVALLAARASYFDQDGDEISSERVSNEYDEKGILSSVTTEYGLAASASETCSVSDCLPLTQTHLTQNAVNNYTYENRVYDSASLHATHTQSVVRTGPFTRGIEDVTEQVEWGESGGPVFATGDEGSVFSGNVGSLESLVGPYSVSRQYEMHDTMFSPQSVTEFAGTDRERLVTYLSSKYSSRYRYVGKEMTSSENTSTEFSPSGAQTVFEKVTQWKAGPYDFAEKIESGSSTTKETLSNILWDSATGQVASVTGDNALTSQFVFDNFGRPISQTAPNGVTLAVDYEFCNGACPSWAQDALMYVIQNDGESESRTYLDLLGREVAHTESSFSGDAIVEYLSYDNRGRVIERSLPYLDCVGCATSGSIFWQYSERYGQVEEVRPNGLRILSYTKAAPSGGTVTSTSYEISGDTIDDAGIVGSLPTAVTNVTSYSDVVGNIVRTEEVSLVNSGVSETGVPSSSDEVITEYRYDPRGNLVWSRVNADNRTVVVRTYGVEGNLTGEYDPDQGASLYRWSIFGELLEEKYVGLDGASERGFTYGYDGLGNITSRISLATGAETLYDYTSYTENGGTVQCGTNLLCRIKGPDSNGDALPDVDERFSYHLVNGEGGAGQLSARSLIINAPGQTAQSFAFSYTYNAFGAPATVSYPNGLVAGYEYQAGVVRKIYDVNQATIWWEADEYDSFGSPSVISLGNGVKQVISRDAISGQEVGRVASLDIAPNNKVQASTYGWDSLGRLSYRQIKDTAADSSVPNKLLRHQIERFSHDAWDRLLSAKSRVIENGIVTAQQDAAYGYDALGNLKARNGTALSYATPNSSVCAHSGFAPGPHAVREVGAQEYCYSAFGEVASVGTRTYSWNPDQTAPTGIADGVLSATFLYGPSGAKRFQLSSDGAANASRWFAGEGYELDIANSVTTTRIYLGDYAVIESVGGVATTRYTLRDHLGSVEVILDDDATDGTSIYDSVIANQSFAPFGQRRDADWVGASGAAAPLDEGYTGHQMLDQFNLIHMNGRVYDPTIGRFLSPDIIIQAPYSSQSYNRYSYVMNGPMMGVDPSGYEACPSGVGQNCYYAPVPSDAQLFPSTHNFMASGSGHQVSLGSLESWASGQQFMMPTLHGLKTGDYSGVNSAVTQSRNVNFSTGFATRVGDELILYSYNDIMRPMFAQEYGVDLPYADTFFDEPETPEAQFGYDLGVLGAFALTRKSGGANKAVAGKITGYTKHGLNQAVGRNGGKGVNAKHMLDAVKNPKKVVEGANGTMKYQGKKATVILNSEGKVITTYGKSRGPQIWPQGTTRASGSGSAQRRANEAGFSYNPKAIR